MDELLQGVIMNVKAESDVIFEKEVLGPLIKKAAEEIVSKNPISKDVAHEIVRKFFRDFPGFKNMEDQIYNATIRRAAEMLSRRTS